MRISSENKFNAVCDVLELLRRLRLVDNEVLLDFVADEGYDWVRCGRCEEFKHSCNCGDESIHSKHYDEDDWRDERDR